MLVSRGLWVGVIGVALTSATVACDSADVGRCGRSGELVQVDDGTQYCVYPGEGRERQACPAAFPVRVVLPSGVVCAERETAPADLPAAVCDRLPSGCVEPGDAGDTGPSPVDLGGPDAGPLDADVDTGPADAGPPPDLGPGDAGPMEDAGPACTPLAPRPLATGAVAAAGPVIVAAGPGYGVAWSDVRGTARQLFFQRIDATGALAGEPTRVTSDEGASAAPDLVWTGSEFALAWHDDRDTNTEIYFTRLSSTGAEIGSDVRVTLDPARSEFPSLAWTGDGYGVAWNDTRDGSFQIYFARLDPAGGRVGMDQRVTTTTNLAASPSLAWTGDGYGVAWHDTRDMMGLQIYFARLDLAGALAGTETRLSDLAVRGGQASLAWSGGQHGVAWMDPTGMGGEIYFGHLDARGVAGGAAIPVTDTGARASGASIAAAGGGFAVAWSDTRDGADSEVWVRALDATGAPASAEVRVTDDATSSVAASVVESGGGLAVVWIDSASEMTGAPWFARVCP